MFKSFPKRRGEKYFHSFPLIVFATIGCAMAAPSAKFDGEYADNKFLHGQGVFEFSIHQTGDGLDIAFDAAYSDGHGAAPDAIVPILRHTIGRKRPTIS